MARTSVKAKGRCCKDGPRCKRCPVVLQRLERAGLAERVGPKRYAVDPELTRAQLRAFR